MAWVSNTCHRKSWVSEIQSLVLVAIAEIDRRNAVARNPALAAMIEAAPNKLMAEIVNGVAQPTSPATTPGARAPEPRGGTGWIDPTPLAPPPGVAILDRMMDAADARDRASRIVDAALNRAHRAAIADTPRAPVQEPTVGEGAKPTPARPTENAQPVQPMPAKQSRVSPS
jgi:hypothetical protein